MCNYRVFDQKIFGQIIFQIEWLNHMLRYESFYKQL